MHPKSHIQVLKFYDGLDESSFDAHSQPKNTFWSSGSKKEAWASMRYQSCPPFQVLLWQKGVSNDSTDYMYLLLSTVFYI